MSRRISLLTRRFLPMAVATALCMTLIMPCASASNQSEIDALKEEAAQIDERREQAQQRLDQLSEDEDEAMARKEALDQDCAIIQEEIDNVSAQIAEYDKLIAEKEEEIAETEAKEEAQYELFCKRVRIMEENGSISYWEVIFKATSVPDLLSRIDFINEIMDYDARIMQDLRDTREQLAQERKELQEAKDAQVEARAELTERQKELEAQRAEADALMKKIHADKATYQDTIDDLDREEDEIQARIVALSQQNPPSSGNATTGVVTSWMGAGGYMWPEKASKKITSPFGSRSSPGGIGSTNHKGVDIGGVGYSTQVLASKAGTVIVSQYSRSYGNYVVVSHGSGNTTLYAHMSSRSVSTGQYVQQGQVLGITGSTGNSTGPHLHFEITEGGVRVNPLNYLTGYVAAW